MTQTQETPAVEATPKAPSKKALATAIFTEVLALRTDGQFDTNRAFRAAVLTRIQAELGVTVASAATMYNSAVKEAGITVGRDPKQVRVRTGSGKKGRPIGSKNRPKVEVAPAAAETAPAVEQVADPVA